MHKSGVLKRRHFETMRQVLVITEINQAFAYLQNFF